MKNNKNREFVRTLHGMIADFLRDNPDIDRSYYQEIWDWLEKKENEDERIRKVLVSIVKWLGFDSSFFIDNSVTKNEVLAYLEKQKEPERIVPEREATDFEIEVHEIIAQARSDKRLADKDILEQFEKEASCALMWKAEKQLRNAERAEAYGEEVLERFREYKEDEDLDGKEQEPEKNITDEQAMDDIHNFKVAVTDLAKTFNIRIDHDRDIDWHNFCASLLTYLKKHQPEEWSKEDEKMQKSV